MKKLLLFSTLFFLQQAKADFWTQKASYPGLGRSRAFCFSINDKGYIGCGDGNSGSANDFYEYDTTANAWTQKANFGGGNRWSGVSFSVNGNGYAGLGWGAAMMDDIWKYDPIADTWTQMNNFPTGQRQVPTSFTIGSKAYVANGRNSGNTFQNDLWEYDPVGDTWAQMANVPGIIRSQPMAFAINGLGYVGCGFDPPLNGLNDFYEYDAVLNSWSTKASLPATGRGDPAGFAIGCRGYTGTGQTLPVNSVLNDFWEFNPATNTWIAKATFLGTARDESAFFSIGGKGYLGLGGVNGGSLVNDFWEYTPDTTCLAPAPIASGVASATSFCANNCISFSNLSLNATTYQWNFFGATPSSSTDSIPQNICYNNAGTFTVVLIASDGMQTDTLTLFNYITVFAIPPAPVITQIGNTLHATGGFASYQWYFGSDTIAGATDSIYTATQNGNYNLAVTDSNGCLVGVGILNVVVEPDGINSFEVSGLGFEVYPNPVRDELCVKRYLLYDGDATLHVYDVLGRNIYSEKITTANFKLQITNWSEGIYLVKITSGENIMTKKIIIEK